MPVNPVALSLGDGAGIGPEIAIKAWQALRSHESPGQDNKQGGEVSPHRYPFILIAPPDLINPYLKAAHLPPAKPISRFEDGANFFDKALPIFPIKGDFITPGTPSQKSAEIALESLEKALSFTLSGDVSALVTNPIAKDNLYKIGFSYPGHTEYLGAKCLGHDTPYARGPVMMLTAGDKLRVALATVHTPLVNVPEHLSSDLIIKRAKVILGALETDFNIPAPRLALCGLNPHAGENGHIGDEEINIINPAAKTLQAQGYAVTNARSADTLFHEEARRDYDAVLAMYHDQGLIPVKMLDFFGGVNITLGLPIIRTSPDHGTAFNIAGCHGAGEGHARADSLIAAIKTAHHLAHNRATNRLAKITTTA